MKIELKKVRLSSDDFEKIGYEYFCLHCGNKVETEEHYHDGGSEGITRECDCKGANEAVRIRYQQKKLEDRLVRLRTKPKVQEKLDLLRFKAAVREAAIEFNQPNPTF